MPWNRKADLRSTVPGPEGPQGLPGVNAVANDTASAAYVDGPSETRTALLRNGLTGWLHVNGFGADPTGIADSTAALQAALAAAQPGDTIYLAGTGSAAGYRIAGDQITITTPSVRIMGSPRDVYATSIRCSDPGTTMFQVKAPGVVFQDVGLWGDADLAGVDAGSNGAGATIVGVEFFGAARGDGDGAIRGVTFQYLALGVLNRARNVEVSQNCLFSNCLAGYRHDGIDPAYHDTADSQTDSNRGNVIRDSRFHNIGTTAATACVEFTSDSHVKHAIVQGNHFDSNSYGRDVVIAGTSAIHAAGVTITGNKHTERHSDVIVLTYADFCTVDAFEILGIQDSANGGHGVYLTNCTDTLVANFLMQYVEKSAIKARGCTRLSITDGLMRTVGTGTATAYDALDIDSTNADVWMSNVRASGGTGWFFTGNPTGTSVMIDCGYSGFTLGGINSTTVMNHSKRGVNSYVEGKLGKVEDIGYGQYDLAAATAKAVATVATTGSNFGSFILEIEASGYDGVAGNAYFSGKRAIRTANGAPVIVVLGTDATAGMTVTITVSGAQGVSVAVQTASATFIGVRVRAVASGSASMSGARNVTVTMAAQP
jgi:hypothetical protein